MEGLVTITHITIQYASVRLGFTHNKIIIKSARFSWSNNTIYIRALSLLMPPDPREGGEGEVEETLLGISKQAGLYCISATEIRLTTISTLQY